MLLNRAPQYGIPFCLQYLAHWPEYFIVGYSECGVTPRHRVFQCYCLTVLHVWGVITQELFLLFTFSKYPTGKRNVT